MKFHMKFSNTLKTHHILTGKKHAGVIWTFDGNENYQHTGLNSKTAG